MSTSRTNESIDDLLEIVDSSLVETYEKLNPLPQGMGSLREINEVYKKADGVLQNHDDKHLKLTLGIMLGMISSMGFAGILEVFHIVTPIVRILICSPLVCGVIFGLWKVWKNEDECKDAQRTKSKYDWILAKFRGKVEALESPVVRTLSRYNKDSIRENLLTYAVQILDAEKKLDIVRLQKQRNVFDMAHLCNWITERRERLTKAEDAAKAFALEFDKSALFNEAAKHVD